MAQTKEASQDFTSPTAIAPVLIGDDGGDGGRDALALGCVLAAARGTRCIAVTEDEPMRTAGNTLLERAEEEHAGTLVVGSPHRGPVGRALLGSVAEHVLHRSPCEVVVAPRGYGAEPNHRLDRIAVAVDGSEGSKVALTRAEDLAREAGAKIEVIVIEDPVVASLEAEFPPEAPRWAADVLEAALASVDPALEPTGKRVDPGWRQVVRTIAAGLAEACDEDVDLLVAGSRRPMERFLLGSVTKHLITEAPCPVLVVPHERRT